MTSRFARLCIGVLCSSLLVDALAQATAQEPPALPQNPPANQPVTGPSGGAAQPSVAPAAPEEEMVLLKLPDADIDTVLSALEIYTGRMVLRPQALPTAQYNIKLTRPIPKAEAILAIETVLALNQISISPLGEKFLKVVPIQQVRTEAPEMITGSAFERPASGKAAAKLFQLEFMRVQEFIPLITGMLNPMYGGAVQFPSANAALITDSISNLQRIETLLQQLDRPVTAGMKPRFYQLQNGAKASDLVNKLRTILSGTVQTQLGMATTFNADDRTNQIVLFTDPRQYAFFDDLIARLDVRADPNTRNEVIYLKHAKAADVVSVLTNIISKQSAALQRANPQSVRPGQGLQPNQQPIPGPSGQPQPVMQPAALTNTLDNVMNANTSEFSSLMTVVNDERSNAVVVSGTADDIRLIKDLIDKLDIVLAQVRIEVVIAEVTLEDSSQSGISALGLKVDNDRLVGFTFATPGASIHGNAGANDFASISRIGGPGSLGRSLDLVGIVNIVSQPRKRNNSIISVPAIVTSHGKQAKFFNGETRPVVTGTIQSAAGGTAGLASSSTVTQQQIGTTLTVTPFIGVDGSVQLDLVQDVQDVIGEVLVDQNKQYVIGQRQTTSYVTAKSGDIMVLGGFRKSSNLKSRNRIGPIPIIGDLFGERTRSKNVQELVFFLRPTVLTNQAAVDNAEALKRVEEFPMRDAVKKELNPNYVPPKTSVIDRILPN